MTSSLNEKTSRTGDKREQPTRGRDNTPSLPRSRSPRQHEGGGEKDLKGSKDKAERYWPKNRGLKRKKKRRREGLGRRTRE